MYLLQRCSHSSRWRALGGACVPPTTLFPQLAVKGTRWRMCTSYNVVPTARGEGHSVAHMYLLQRCEWNHFKTTSTQYLYMGFSRRNKILCCSAYDIRESNPVPAFQTNLDRLQKLISLSMSRHLSTHDISSKSMHGFFSNLANRQTDEGTWANAFTSSFVGGN